MNEHRYNVGMESKRIFRQPITITKHAEHKQGTSRFQKKLDHDDSQYGMSGHYRI